MEEESKGRLYCNMRAGKAGPVTHDLEGRRGHPVPESPWQEVVAG
jgi:hypothetical protein